MKLLRKDIERYYLLAGNTKKVGFFTVLKSFFNPRLLPVVLLRVSAFFGNNHLRVIAKFLSIVNFVLFGIETSTNVKIGGGLFLPHTMGTILGAESIGKNVTIMHGVTLGAKEFDMQFSANSRPIIGDNVFIGAGAKVIGSVNIGNNAKIGANAVVLNDVPSGSLAVGVPAVVKQIKS